MKPSGLGTLALRGDPGLVNSVVQEAELYVEPVGRPDWHAFLPSL